MKNSNITICCLLGMMFITDVQAEEANENKWKGLFQALSKNFQLPQYLDFTNNDFTLPFINKAHTWGGREYYAYNESYKELGIRTQVNERSVAGFKFSYENGRGGSRNNAIRGMQAIDKTPTANLFFHYEDDDYTGTVSITKGLTSKNTGLVISTGLGYNKQLSEKLSTSATLSMNWADKNYVNGALKLNNVIPVGEQTYSGNSSVLNYGLSAGAHYQIEKKHSLRLNTAIGTISESGENSVIDNDIQAALTLGYTYKF